MRGPTRPSNLGWVAMPTFRDRIRELRTLHFPSQEAFAYRVGVSRGTVQNWEAGKHLPKMAEAMAAADLFGVSLDYLMGRSDDPGRTGATGNEPAAEALVAALQEGERDTPLQTVGAERRRRSRRRSDSTPPA